jgi:hypothetical protein
MQILDFRQAPPNETHLAEFSVRIPVWDVTFHMFKLRRSRNGHLFVASPSFFDKNSEDEQKWHPFIEFSKEKKDAFDKKVMELVVPMLEKFSL